MKSKNRKKNRRRTAVFRKKKGEKVASLASSGLEEKARLLSAALESLRDSVYITDREHTIIYANPAIQFVQGYQPEDVIGEKANKFFEGVPGNPPRLARLIEKEAKDGFWIGEVYNRRKDGSLFPVQLIENTIYDKQGEVLGYVGISRDISERRNAEQKLAESEEKYRLLTENLISGIYIISAKGKILFANKAFQILSGYSAGELEGKTIFSLVYPRDRGWVKKYFSKRIKGQSSPDHYQCRALHKDGSVRWIELRATPINYQGQPAVLGNFLEITEQKRTKDALLEKEKRFRDIAEHTLQWIWEVDTKGKYTYASPVVEKILGYKPEEVLKKHFYDFFHPEDREKLKKAAFKMFESKLPFREFTNRNVHRNGETVWLSTSGVPIIDDENNLVGYRGTDINITRRHRAEESLKESEQQYRAIFEQAPDSVLLIDARTGKLINFNERAHESLGYTRHEFQKLKISDFEVKESAGEVRRHLEKIVEEGSGQFETKQRRKDGEIRDILVRTRAITIGGKDFIQAMWRDITEQKRMEKALRESEVRYRTTIDSMGDPIHVVDPDLRILLINQALKHRLRDLKLDPEVIGNKIGEAFPYLTEKVFQEYEEVFTSGRMLITEESGVYGGRKVISETRKIPVIDKGKTIRVITVIRDITERKQAEARLRESSKLEAVGTLSLGIAHEFNNILMGISGYAQLALADLNERMMVRKAFDTILRQSDRGRTLIRRLSAFGKREKPQPAPVDLTKIMDEAVDLQKRELKLADIRVRRIYRQPPYVLADYSQIEQVFFNLIMNARQALIDRKQGVITLRVENREEMVEASVSDNGKGIGKEELSKIFLPFFTTKERENRREIPSLGLGLWVCKQIVEEHGGEIEVKSEGKKGSTFTVTLPRAGKLDPEEKGKKIKVQAGQLARQKILVVDDEPDLVEVYKEYLESKGALVTAFTKGDEALRFCREKEFDTILLDYVMPGLSGKKLCEEIMKAAPESRVVIISGRPLPEAEEKILRPRVFAVLSKPIKLAQLDKFLS